MPKPMPLDEYMARVELKRIRKAIRACEGNRTQAARELGITFRSLRYRIMSLTHKANNTTIPPPYDARWPPLRYAALKKYGNRCQCCGSTPKNGSVLHVDHIKPRNKYPELTYDINNLQILCARCRSEERRVGKECRSGWA